MATVEVTERNFESTVKQGIVVLDFRAPWGGRCRAGAPTLEAASARYPDVIFGEVDSEAEPGLAAACGIEAVPSLMVVRDGVVLATLPGAWPVTALDELLAKVRALDMKEVHRNLIMYSAGNRREPAVRD